jgi:hypothetical protein
MREKTLTRFSILLLSIAFLVIVPVIADDTVAPQLPHAFIGSVLVNNTPAGQGLVVEAVGLGVRSNIPGNPVVTLSDGTYGSVNFSSQKLMVQGNIATGTPLEFYVGGIKAEVNDVAKGDSWATSYPYTPGELTELNLRIATQPSVGQTREPTPVQTSGSSVSIVSSEVTASTGGVSGSTVLPQVPDSQGQQSGAQATEPSGSTQTGTTEQGSSSPQGEAGQTGGQGSEASPVALPASGTMTAYIVGGILFLLVIAGGVYYYTSMKKGEAEKTEESEKKEE